MSNKKKTFLIIDGNAIIHRAYHALPPMTAKDGTSVNAVYGFASMLMKVLKEFAPDYIAVSFDVKGPTFRDELYAEYKATREKADDDLYAQIPLCHKVVEAFNIPILTKQGFEADDVIGTVAEQNKQHDVTTIIVTGDKDLLQLVDDNITEVYLLRKGLSDFALYNEQKVREKFGFGPEHIIDYKALRGDPSDNIPGVRGIGDKTATTLITHVGGIDLIYKKLDELEEKAIVGKAAVKKLKEQKWDAELSYKLATILRDVAGVDYTLASCHTHDFNRDTVVQLFKQCEFYSLLKRIPGAQSVGVQKKQKVKTVRVTTVNNKNAQEFVQAAHAKKQIALDVLVRGDDVFTAELDGFVAVIDGDGFYVNRHGLDLDAWQAAIAVFADEDMLVIGHDVKQTIKHLFVHGIALRAQLFDIMIASYLLNSSTRVHDLKTIFLRELGQEISTTETEQGLFGADPQRVANELARIMVMSEQFEERLSADKMDTLFHTIEMPLVAILARMELTGVAVDEGVLATLSKEVAERITELEKQIWWEADEEFNVSSSVQLREVLYDRLALPTDGIKKGKTGYSTAASELAKLREYHPIIEQIEEYREVEKLRNTYIDVLPTLVHQKTGRIHTSFNQTVTTTGRLSSSNPNLQNIPIRSKLGRRVRDAFVSAEGYTLVAADYSQIELRIAAHVAHDTRLIAIFNENKDVHTATAATIHDVALDDVSKAMRRKAKEVNFGVLYGMGAYGLAARTGISHAEAGEFIDRYFSSFAGVKDYIAQTIDMAKKQGYVETLFGRRRYVPELTSGNKQLQRAGERMAVNMPIQGTAADLMKKAMIDVDQALRDAGIGSDVARVTLQVHDEIVLEVAEDRIDEIKTLVKKTMEQVMTLAVPVVVDVEVGKRWGKVQ